MRLSRLLYLISFCFVLLATPALAHEFILKPDGQPHVAKAATATGQVQAAHIFMQSEEAEVLQDVSLQLVSTAQTSPVEVAEVANEPWLRYSFTSPDAGAFMLTGWRKPQLWSQTTQGILPGDRASLEKTGKTVLSVGKYEKFAKTLYNVQPKADIFNKPVGQPLEIIPLADIGTLRSNGEPFPFAVLLHGKRIEVPLKATYDGFSQQGDEYALTIKPENSAMHVPFSHSGLWLLQAETTLKTPNTDADTHNIRATFVIQVP